MIDHITQELNRREAEEHRWLAIRPRCSECGDPIQDEKLYNINGDLYCEECIENFKEDTEDKSTPTPDVVKSAYDKLRTNMTADEFSSFTSIMKKLDIDTLKTYLSDKAGLKQYLHASLTDEEYSKIVNLGYKYVSIFIDDEN